MRKLKIKAAALCCAAGCALLAGCAAQDGAGTATERRANNAARVAATPPAARPAQPGPQRDAHGHVDTARRITVTELRDLIAKGQAVAVDVRSPEAYRQGHIKGAILLPSDEVRARAKELPKDKLLVFYCA